MRPHAARAAVLVTLGLCGCSATCAPAMRGPRAVTPPVYAEPPAPLPEAPQPRIVSIVAEDEALSELILDLARRLDRRILLATGLERRVTLTLRDLPWRDALRALAAWLSLELVESEDAWLLRAPPATQIRYEDADLRVALLQLARHSGQSIVIGPDVGPGVRGRVSVELRGVRPERALELIAESAGAAPLRED